VKTEVSEFLHSVYFFRELSESPLDELAKSCTRETVEPGDIVFAEGETGDRFYIVISGMIEIWKNFSFPERRKLGEHGAGSLFGEMALVDSLSRSATARAARKSEVYYLTRKDFERIVELYPSVAMTVMRSLSYIIRNSNESFVADLNQRNRELEAAYQKLEAAQVREIANERFSNLGKFSNMILHDLRNPLSVLNGYTRILDSVARDPAQVSEYARRIGVETARLSQLAGELLDYTRGEIRLDMTVSKPSELIDAAVRYVRDRMKSRGIALELRLNSDTSVMVDRDRMIRVLVNILDNARKACATGGTVSVDADQNGEQLTFVVRDDGEGMDERTMEHVFEPFFSRSSSGGTGLGMVIVKSVIEAHGGELFLESSPGNGTVVTVRVPGRIQ